MQLGGGLTATAEMESRGITAGKLPPLRRDVQGKWDRRVSPRPPLWYGRRHYGAEGEGLSSFFFKKITGQGWQLLGWREIIPFCHRKGNYSILE